MTVAPLLEPFRIKNLRLRNRFVMSPMTRGFAPNGVIVPEMSDYYRRRAEGGVGLIISEGIGLDRPGSRHLTNVPILHEDEPRAAWARALAGVQAAGAAMAPQLWHVGGHSDPLSRPELVDKLESPAGLVGPDRLGGRAMTEEDVVDTIRSFAASARAAADLGFDAIELHGAHGYLIDQFFWRETNLRTDRYGGSTVRDRARFAHEVVRVVRDAIEPSMAIILRISQWKLHFYDARVANTPDELEPWLGPLAEAGVDLFDCSQRRFWEPAFEGSDLNLAGWVKKVIGAPTMTVGSVGLDRDVMSDFEGGTSQVNPRSFAELVRRFDRGDFDLVGVGRALLADPHWLEKVRDERWHELRPYEAKLAETLR